MEAGPLRTQKIIIDADPGIGDALAIAVALSDPQFDVIGVTATAGCVSGPVATRNVQAIVERLDPPKWPRLGGTNADLSRILQLGALGQANPSLLNGPSGLGDCRFDVADLHHQRESAKLMIDLVRDAPHEITLLTLGPLTNVELACERAPNFLSLLKGLVCLGGTVEQGGDVTSSAEFNIYANPAAARLVLRSPATKTLVPLETSRSVNLTFDQYDGLPTSESTAMGRMLRQLLPFAFRAYHEHLGLEGIPLNEVVALAVIAQPQLFHCESMVVDVETRGDLTRGMTVFDRRSIRISQPNIDVARSVDAQGVVDYFHRISQSAR